MQCILYTSAVSEISTALVDRCLGMAGTPHRDKAALPELHLDSARAATHNLKNEEK